MGIAEVGEVAAESKKLDRSGRSYTTKARLTRGTFDGTLDGSIDAAVGSTTKAAGPFRGR